ncbi:hypothetical protein B0H14DRAFT_3506996 [Mycena olivaceomarginata]|nr:hypothetical protein B0H14DRAFT_3506996 [Mycena olivaceomarginata]
MLSSKGGVLLQRAPLLTSRDLVAARRSVSHARECPPLAVCGRLFHPARRRLLALGGTVLTSCCSMHDVLRSRLPYRAPTSVLGTIRRPFTSRAAVFDASPARPRQQLAEETGLEAQPQGQEILHVQDLCHKHPFLLPPRPLTWCVFIAAPNCRWPPAPPAAATFALARRVHGASTSRVRLTLEASMPPGPLTRHPLLRCARNCRRVAGAASQRATPVSLSTYTAPSSARTLLRLRHRQSPHARKRLLSLSSPSAAPSPRCWIYCLSTAPAARSPRAPLLHRVRTAEERALPARRRLSVEYAAAPTATTASLARASVLASPAPARIVRHSHSASAPFFDPAFRAGRRARSSCCYQHAWGAPSSSPASICAPWVASCAHRSWSEGARLRDYVAAASRASEVGSFTSALLPAPHFNRTLRAASVRAELAHPSRSDTLALGRTTPDAVRALEGVLQCGSTVPAPLGARAVAITSRAAGRSDDPYLRPHRRPSPFDIGWATCARKHLLAPYWASTHVVHPV